MYLLFWDIPSSIKTLLRYCHYLSVGRDCYQLFTIMKAIKGESQLTFFSKIVKSKSKNSELKRASFTLVL